MAYLAVNNVLCREKWPAQIGRPIGQQQELPSWKMLSTAFEDLSESLSIDRAGSGTPQVFFAHSDLEEQGITMQFMIRVQGVVAESNLATLGTWSGDEGGIPKAMQYMVLTSGGCAAAFDPQCGAVIDLEEIICGVFGSPRTARVARKGAIRLRRRVFTKVQENTDAAAQGLVLSAREDPMGKAASFGDRWVVDHRVKVGIQHEDGRVTGTNPKAIRRGDLVDVLVSVDVVSMNTKHGRKHEVQFAPHEVIRLKTATEFKDAVAAANNGITASAPSANKSTVTKPGGYAFHEEMDVQ